LPCAVALATIPTAAPSVQMTMHARIDRADCMVNPLFFGFFSRPLLRPWRGGECLVVTLDTCFQMFGLSASNACNPFRVDSVSRTLSPLREASYESTALYAALTSVSIEKSTSSVPMYARVAGSDRRWPARTVFRCVLSDTLCFPEIGTRCVD
jgi:hypothetical protein